MPSAPPTKALTYRDLAWWAEAADGMRDDDLVIAEVEEKGEIKLKVKRKGDVKPEQIKLEGIRTPFLYPPKRPVTRVMVEIDGKTIECKSKEGIVCDAVFCTESSIEKFLFLYYHAQRLLTPEEWDDLYAALRDPDVVAIGHVWPSSKVKVEKPGETAVPGAGGDGRAAGDEEMFYVLKAGLDAIGDVAWQSLSEYQRPS